MDELVGALLAGLLEIFGEALGELICGLLVRGIYRVLVRTLGKRRLEAASMGLVLLTAGALCGFLSAWLMPHPLVPRSPLHGISVVMSPLLVGLATWQISRLFQTAEEKSSGREDFWNGAAFAFGMALVRLLMVG